MNAPCPYIPFRRFILRLPAFPVSLAMELLQGAKIDPAAIRNIIRDPRVQEAIYLASPAFFPEMMKWCAATPDERRDTQRVFHSCIRYISRMAFRPTPFGLFAGLTTGLWSEKSCIEISSHTEWKSTTRFDMGLLIKLSRELRNEAFLRSSLHYFPNRSMYAVDKSLRFTERQPNGRCCLVAVERSEWLDGVLHHAEYGATYTELVSLLRGKGCTRAGSEAFIRELAAHQVLVDELYPSVTGPDYFCKIVEVLKRTGSASKVTRLLERLDTNLRQLDAVPVGRPVATYKGIISLAKKFSAFKDSNHFFRTDLLVKAKTCELEASIAQTVLKGAGMLARFTLPRPHPGLSAFAKRFTARYGTREIPLLLALDADTGIGYEVSGLTADVAPFLEGYAFPEERKHLADAPLTTAESYLLNRFLKMEKGSPPVFRELIIDEDDPHLPPLNWSVLPQTLAVVFRIMESRRLGVSDKEVVLVSTGGMCAANLIARFCHLHPELLDLAEGIVAAEQEASGDALLAEIVHLPSERAGNILARPALRQYEILYLAASGLANGSAIPVSDLLIAVRDHRIILRSKKLGKQIIPRLTATHNYVSRKNLPVYRFLCDVQSQGHHQVEPFSWGRVARLTDFLPRVRSHRLILSPAMWKIQVRDLKWLEAVSPDEFPQACKQWKDAAGIPDWIGVIEKDKEWILNTRNQDCLKALCRKVSQQQELWISEVFADPDTSPVRSSSGNYFHEFIAFFSKSLST